MTSLRPRGTSMYFALLAGSAVRMLESSNGSGQRAFLGEFCQHSACEQAAVFLFTKGNDHPQQVSYADRPFSQLSWGDLPVLMAKLGRFEPVTIHDVNLVGQDWSQEVKWLADQKLTAAIFAPLLMEEKLVGMIVVASSAKQEWTGDDVVATRACGQFVLQDWLRNDSVKRHRRISDRATALVEALPVCVALSDTSGRISWWNRAAASYFGGRSEIPFQWEQLVDLGDLGHFQEEIAAAINETRRFIAEVRMRRSSDNSMQWVAVRAEPRLEDGVFSGHTITLVDISERVRSVELAAQRARFTQDLLGVVRRFVDIDAQDIAEAIDSTLGTLGRYLSLDRVTVSLLDRTTDTQLEFRSATEWSADTLPSVDELERIPVSEIPHLFAELRNLRSVPMTRVGDLPIGWSEERTSAQRRGVRSSLWSPIPMRGRLGGILWLISSTAEREWNDVMPVVRIIAEVIGNALEQLRSEDELHQQAVTDRLTNALNRAGSVDALNSALVEDGPLGFTTAVLFLDLDGFKGVNDTYGHEAGDEVLVEVSVRLRSLIRPSDLIGRLGGDEFVLLCRNISDLDDALNVGTRIIESVSVPIELAQGGVARIGVSVGIALVDGSSWSAEEVLRISDEAMYKAKKNGKNQLSLTDRREFA